MLEIKPYDVFLSYNSKDRTAVKQLAICLQDKANLKVWFDEWNLIPGESWQEELEKALDMSKTCAVFIGPGSIGPWHNEEMRSALQIRVEQNQFRIIPVLLPGAKLPERGKLPRFLSRLHSVDFRGAGDVCQHRSFNRLVAGIRGIPPGRDDDVSPNIVMTEYPYRGLEVFDEEHAKFFFGREALTQHLVEALQSTCFLAVLGASGCGKSSLARAGLLPMLKAGALPASDQWTYIVFKPGGNPLQELAMNLVRAGQVEDRLTETRRVLRNLESDESSLHIYVRQLLEDTPKDSRLFILIDQFEEIFTLCKDQEEQTRFIKNLRYAATAAGGKTIITLTMRADFLARASGYIELAEMLSGHQFVVSRMDETDFRQAIEEPARLVGLQFEKGLVNKILGRDSEKRLISNKDSDKLFFHVCAKKKSLVRGVHHCTSKRMAYLPQENKGTAVMAVVGSSSRAIAIKAASPLCAL